MALQIIGPRPFLRPENTGGLPVRIGTLFPGHEVLCTLMPGVHALQRLGFIDHLNAERNLQGQPPLSPAEEERISHNSVDLIFEEHEVMIRPDPDRMDLAFAADELLQGLISKRKIKFLSVSDKRVREAIKLRGEIWRLSGVPKSREAKRRLIEKSKVCISGLPIYNYNRLTGTRWLTFYEFERLGALEPAALAAHLQEIADHAVRRNRVGRPELDFFAADLRRFGSRAFGGVHFQQLEPGALRQKFEEIREHFRSAVHEAFRVDNPSDRAWSERMLSTLFLEGNETQAEQVLSGLSPEFFMQVEWLPGGRFEGGEFLPDSIFEEAATNPGDPALQELCDTRARGIILDFLRDYGDLQFINVGCVPESLSLDRPQTEGRRGVYLAEFGSASRKEPIRRFLRIQKWGVWEHLDEGKDLLRSILESDEYTDYCLDRRLGCRQLGMNLVRRITVRRLSEVYHGKNAAYHGQLIRTAFFEREYVAGIATDKLPWDRYGRPGYAERFAELLGRAAAASLVVGRSLGEVGRTPFDDGDEVVLENEQGFPTGIMVADHTGAFGEYKLPLESMALSYARPVNKRDKLVPDPLLFAELYLKALGDHIKSIQKDYRRQRRAFDNLFKHAAYDPLGSFAYRWECVLARLDRSEPETLIREIQRHISVLNSGR